MQASLQVCGPRVSVWPPSTRRAVTNGLSVPAASGRCEVTHVFPFQQPRPRWRRGSDSRTVPDQSLGHQFLRSGPREFRKIGGRSRISGA